VHGGHSKELEPSLVRRPWWSLVGWSLVRVGRKSLLGTDTCRLGLGLQLVTKPSCLQRVVKAQARLRPAPFLHSPSQGLQRCQVLHRESDCLPVRVPPNIAGRATAKVLTAVVDFDQRLFALGADAGHLRRASWGGLCSAQPGRGGLGLTSRSNRLPFVAS
jgi:hypothetical protein